MSRTLSATLATAVSKTATQPKYLVDLGFTSGTVYAATWDSNISYGGNTYVASGIEVSRLDSAGATLEFPNGTADPWLSLILNDGTRGAAITIYLHYTDATASPTTDAIALFTGIMDEADIDDDRIRVKVIAASEQKTFPPNSIDQPTFTYLPASGTVIEWGNDKLVVN